MVCCRATLGVLLVCAVWCLPADPLAAELTLDDLRAALDSSDSVFEASTKLRALLEPRNTRRSALHHSKAWPVDKLDTNAVALLQMEEPHIFAPKIGWNDPDSKSCSGEPADLCAPARPTTMSEFCAQHYSCTGEAQAEGKKDSRAARQDTRKAERKLREVKRRAARTIRNLKRQEATNFAESLKYGVKAKTDKLSRKLKTLKKAQAKWEDEKLTWRSR